MNLAQYNRPILQYLDEFAAEKFVFLSGPRQVGKTTLAKTWLENKEGVYLNWDSDSDKKLILKQNFLKEPKPAALVLDEIHKYQRWKSYLKGLYDKEAPRLKVIVTGSARLDIYQRGGDSLFGRYELLRLHQFSMGELTHKRITPPPDNWLTINPTSKPEPQLWKRLEKFSGFPAPFLKQNPLQHTRWVKRRKDLLLKEDLRDLTKIRSLSLVEHLMILLPDKVGSPLSVNFLREDLRVAHDTVSDWLNTLERLYLIFRINTFSKKLNRSIQLEKKLYLWDWTQIEDEGARFENMVACHLLKAVHTWNDIGYGDFELMYLRDKEKREVDFVITSKRKPIVLIEAKLSDTAFSAPLLYFGKILGDIPKIQLVKTQGVDRSSENARIVSADLYLSALP